MDAVIISCIAVVAYGIANLAVYALFAKELKEVRRLERKYERK